MKKTFLLLLISGFLVSCKVTTQTTKPSSREMRALWTASVLNLDFPSSQKLTTAEQKQEFINILDSMQKYNLNTIVMQIRPAGDVLYDSPFEPWSEVLTGKQGQAPHPYYDPLQFMIEESHKRTIDFHAWLNPYRALMNHDNAKLAPNHLTKTRPEWFVKYGKHTYYNPALPEVRHFIAKIVGDITRRYAIDAIHMDDYFYPYRIANHDFPDDKEFQLYNRGHKNKDDWRRENVNLIIQELRDTIKQAKPWVQFGISPFGVWRNAAVDKRGSNTKAGQTNYDDLYADILLWMEKGWIDYVTPQVYWHIGHPLADYATIAKWWNDNTKNTHLYIGLGAYKSGNDATYMEWNDNKELLRQLQFNKTLNKVNGTMYFRAMHFNDSKLNFFKKELKENFYKYPTLLPPSKGVNVLDNFTPKVALDKLSKGKYKLSWTAPKGSGANELKYYVVYMFEGKRKLGDMSKGESIFTITSDNEIIIEAKKGRKARKRTFVVTRVNKANQESAISELIYKKL